MSQSLSFSGDCHSCREDFSVEISRLLIVETSDEVLVIVPITGDIPSGVAMSCCHRGKVLPVGSLVVLFVDSGCFSSQFSTRSSACLLSCINSP